MTAVTLTILINLIIIHNIYTITIAAFTIAVITTSVMIIVRTSVTISIPTAITISLMISSDNQLTIVVTITIT